MTRLVRSAVASMALIIAVGGCESTRQAPTAGGGLDAAERLIARAEAADGDAARARAYLAALVGLHGRGDAVAAAGIVDRLLAPNDAGGAPLAAALDDSEHGRLRRIALALAAGDIARRDRLAAAFDGLRFDRDALAGGADVLALIEAGDHRSAAAALLDLAARAPTGSPGLARLGRELWRGVSTLSIQELDALARQASDAEERVWWTLVRERGAGLTAAAQEQIWRKWRKVHPNHAGARLPPPGMAGPAPARIALLVPLGGSLAAAAEAVRDGLAAAYLHAKPEGQTVRVYDTGDMSVAEAYRRANADGADVVVGPLAKSAVRELAALRPELPVVALNSLDAAPAAPGLLQLAIPVEDEAAAIAAALVADGMGRVVLFDSRAAWSERARRRLEADLGGVEIVAVGTMRGATAATTIAGDALGIAASGARHQELERLLGRNGTIEFTARRRADVDAVVALVEESELLSLKPALIYHFAGDLPVYVPSPALRGGDGLARLGGVRLCDIPWRLDSGALRAAASRAIASSRGATASFFALGVDGFRIANQLDRLTRLGESIAGSTGVLTLAEGGRIKRRLAWGQVADGRLVPLASGGG